MGACAIHKLFFLSTMVVWMFVTIYIFRSGTGISGEKSESSMIVMEELQRQNAQLRKITTHLNNLMESKSEKKSDEDDKASDGILDTLRSGLNQCSEHNKQLTEQLKLFKIKSFENSKKTYSNRAEDQQVSNDTIGSVDIHAREVYDNIIEMWYYLNSRLTKMREYDGLPREMYGDISKVLREVKERKSAALIEVELMRNAMNEVQATEMRKLSILAQKRIHFLQNPKDCTNAKKLTCNLNKSCGFGCQVHHVVHCLLVALGTGRTMILQSKNWRYDRNGWESIFLPLSSTCTDVTSGDRVKWTGEENTRDAMVVSLSIIDGMIQKPPYLPLSIPQDLSSQLVKYHGNPAAWWLGQVTRYLMRPQKQLSDAIKVFMEKVGFSHPVAGIHIRRTDKVGSEADFHSISEYMVHVIDWFDKEELKRQRLSQPGIKTRKVYVASDDSTVLDQAKKLYPEYEFLGDSEISKSAGTATRYSQTSLIGVVNDIILLSKCDYLVGTFSSQVTRLAYELMQTYHPDASAHVHSLDDIFYYGGQGKRVYTAIYDHDPKSNTKEIEIHAGDSMGVAGNHWDGFSKGVNHRTGKTGLYPSYKVREIATVAKFPTYPEAENFELHENINDIL